MQTICDWELKLRDKVGRVKYSTGYESFLIFLYISIYFVSSLIKIFKLGINSVLLIEVFKY